MKKENFMLKAINMAQKGIREGAGGPFGACIVKNGEVVAMAHNTVLRDKDATCHAEVNAIRQASEKLGTHILSGCEIYTSAEPCPMCLGAIYWARLDKIVVAASKETAAKYDFDDHFFYEQMEKPPEARAVPCEIGVCADESEAVFVEWQASGGKLY